MGPTAGPANRGDPHLTTTNDVHFDFQTSGEFTALEDQDVPFELQTRQTPVLTSFVPEANPYTGLASCVSLNTAVALRIGEHRVSYQPQGRGGPGERVLELRIDGEPTKIGRDTIKLGEGNAVSGTVPAPSPSASRTGPRSSSRRASGRPKATGTWTSRW